MQNNQQSPTDLPKEGKLCSDEISAPSEENTVDSTNPYLNQGFSNQDAALLFQLSTLINQSIPSLCIQETSEDPWGTSQPIFVNYLKTEDSSFHIILGLRLRNCNLEEFPCQILELSSLTHLDLAENQIDDVPLIMVNKLPLKYLDLQGNPLSQLPGLAVFLERSPSPTTLSLKYIREMDTYSGYSQVYYQEKMKSKLEFDPFDFTNPLFSLFRFDLIRFCHRDKMWEYLDILSNPPYIFIDHVAVEMKEGYLLERFKMDYNVELTLYSADTSFFEISGYHEDTGNKVLIQDYHVVEMQLVDLHLEKTPDYFSYFPKLKLHQ